MERKAKRWRKTVSSWLVITLIGFIAGFLLTSPRKNPFPRLPEPNVSTVYLPGPLVFAPPATSILGAQPIDPHDLIAAVNNQRVKHGAKPLRVSTILGRAAQMRADVILKYQNFSHQDPQEGIELVTVLPKVGYHFTWASENIGMGGTSGPDFVSGFMNSTSHRKNLLNPDLVDTGAAIVSGPYKQYYVNIAVQLFAIPGGKDEYLGYTESEVKHYQEEIAYLDGQLGPLRWVIGKVTQPSFYSDERYRKLTRQKEIVVAIYARMEKVQPLSSEDADLVVEYNRLTEELTQGPRS